jgi:peptide methionine sulfoxide reductase MsrB
MTPLETKIVKEMQIERVQDKGYTPQNNKKIYRCEACAKTFKSVNIKDVF